MSIISYAIAIAVALGAILWFANWLDRRAYEVEP